MTPKTLVSCLILLLVSCQQPTFSERYKQKWRDPNDTEFITIGRALVRHNIGDCGAYYVRESSLDPGEYVVGCTLDWENFNYYLVWPSTESVTSISATEIDIAPKGIK